MSWGELVARHKLYNDTEPARMRTHWLACQAPMNCMECRRIHTIGTARSRLAEAQAGPPWAPFVGNKHYRELVQWRQEWYDYNIELYKQMYK